MRTVLFSDSVYFASDNIMVVGMAVRMIGLLAFWEIPSRAGIASGAFISLDWATRFVGPYAQHEAGFFGSGVVRSYFAESKGARGLRAIVHPSIAAELSNAFHSGVCDLPADQVTEHGAHELNLLSNVWWKHDTPFHWKGDQPFDLLEAAILRLQNGAPPEVLSAYQSTLEAIERMRRHL